MVPKVGGIVLCGGQSRRMGTAKAWLPIGPDYLLQRIVATVASVVHPVIVAARPQQSLPALPQDVEVVPDSIQDAGPLAGIAAGLAKLANRAEAAFVVSCDHPLLSPPFARGLIDLLADAPGIMPVRQNQHYPLVAVYRVHLQPTLVEMLARGQFRVQDFATKCGVRIVDASKLQHVDPELDSLRNMNDPEAYSRLLRDLQN